MAKTVRFTY